MCLCVWVYYNALAHVRSHKTCSQEAGVPSRLDGLSYSSSPEDWEPEQPDV